MGAGIRPEIDLAQARTAVSNARVQLVTANNNRAVALAQLEQAMGVTEHVDYELADSALSPVAGEDGPLENLVDERGQRAAGDRDASSNSAARRS